MVQDHMVLDHKWGQNLKKKNPIINGPVVQNHKVLMARDHIVLDHKSRPKSRKKLSEHQLFTLNFTFKLFHVSLAIANITLEV